jgi:uroporphyrinogen-III synthase
MKGMGAAVCLQTESVSVGPTPSSALSGTFSRKREKGKLLKESRAVNAMASENTRGTDMRLLVTRPQGDADILKARLEQLGHQVIVSPLLEIVPRPDIRIPNLPYQLIALTSANAMRCLAGNAYLDRLRHLPVIAVGPQSADAARRAGFASITGAGGDGVRLARRIGVHTKPDAGPILYLSGLDTASDFAGRLERSGFTVTRIIAYEARPAARLSPDAAQAEGVLLYSPRSARLWLDLAAKEGIASDVMIHYCLSANIAAILPDGLARRVATRPDEDALLEIIGRASTFPA